MDRKELEERTKNFAIDVIKIVDSFPKNKTADVIGYQILKSATSIGANYREAARAESRADFVHKIGVVEKETSETLYWADIISPPIINLAISLGMNYTISPRMQVLSAIK